jgi:hypothetical protein
MGFDVAFDAEWWARHWWLVFPVAGFILAFFSMSLDHRRKLEEIRAMKRQIGAE